MSKIAFVLPNLSGGGAARVASILCNEWQNSGEDVHLITFEDPGEVSVYSIAASVTRHQIGYTSSKPSLVGFLKNNIQRVFALRRVLRGIRPRVVVSFLLDANAVTVMACRSLRVPVVVSERNHPAYYQISAVKSCMRSLTYPRANLVVVQTEDIQQWFLSNCSIEAAVIPNPVVLIDSRTDEPLIEAQTASGRSRLITLGRLEVQKGHDRLIEAFSLIADDVPNWDLVIFGEGSERKSLERLIIDKGLIGRISMPGVTQSPRRELRVSDVYVHAAHYEGYPNTLIEALSEGLCVVAIDTPGVAEVLENGRYGVLVSDTGSKELADGLLMVIDDGEVRNSLACEASGAVDFLEPDKIATRWLNMVADVV